ncbi:unnamed protein product [Closterium sp. NIES-53]
MVSTRICSLTLPHLPQSLTSLLTSTLVTPATALHFPLIIRLPDSLASVKDHFLSLCPTELTVDLLEERLTAAEKSIVAVGASHGNPRAPFFEGCSPVPLLPFVASTAVVDLVGAEVGAASAPSGRRRNSKGKGGKGGGGDGGGGGGGVGGGGGGGGGDGGGGRSGGFGGGGGGGGGSGSGGGGSGSGGGGGGGGEAGRDGAAQRGGFGGSQCQQQPRSCETPSAQGDLLKQNVAIFDIDFDAILAAMYVVTDSAEGDCYLCVPPDPGIEAAALGASACAAPGTGESAAPGAGESALSGTAPTFTLDSGASRSFFRDSTTLTPLCLPVAVSLADPSGGSVLAHSSMVLPCPAAPSGLLSGLHLPSFSTNMVTGADLQELWVDQFTPGGQRVTHCTCSRTGRHLATFTRRPGSSLYTLTTASPPITVLGQVAESGQVFAAASRSSPASAPCSCHPLSHETLLWHHRLGHPSLPRLRGMASRTLVSSLPSPSLSFLRGLPLPVFLVSRAGSAPLLTPPSSLRQRLPCRLSTWTCGAQPASVDRVTSVTSCWSLTTTRVKPQSSPYAARTKVVSSPLTFQGPSDVRRASARRSRFRPPRSKMGLLSAALAWSWTSLYAAHQINLQPCVSLPETTPTLRWTGKDVTFDESVSYYCLFPYRTASLPPPPPLFLAPGAPPVDPLPPQGPASSGVSQVDPVEPIEVAVNSGAARGVEPAGAGPGGAVPGVAESEDAEPVVAEPERVEPGGAEPERAESGGPPGVPSRREPLSPQRLLGGASGVGAAGGAAGARAAGAGGACTGGTGAAGAGGAAGVGAVVAGAVATGGAAGAGAAGGNGAGGDAGVVAGDPGAEGTSAVYAVSRGVALPRPHYVPLLQQVLGLPPSTGPTPPLLSPPPVQSQSQLQTASPLPGPCPYSGPTRGLTEGHEHESRPASPESRPASPESRPESPVCSMTLCPSTAPQRVPLASPPASSLPDGPEPESGSLRAASPTVTRFLATAVTDPSFESTAASALVAELADFAAACRLDYAASLVTESASVCPPTVVGECALGTDVLEDRQEDFECFATHLPHLVSMLLAPEGDPDAPDISTSRSYAEVIEGPYSSQWKTAMDTQMASWKSTGTYVDEVPSPGANIVSGMWIFKVKRPPGSPPVFKACYWHDTLKTTFAALGFAPSTADPSLFLCTDTTLPPFLVLVYVDDLVFASADTEALAHVKSELQKRHTCTDLGELRCYLGLRITRDRAQHTITLTQSHMVQQVLQRFGFTYSSPQSTPLPTGHSLSAPPSDKSVEPSGPYPELVGCLMYLMTCTRPDLAYPLSILARYVAPSRHRKEHMDAAKRVLRYLCSTSGMGLVLGGRARVVLTGHADASWVDDLATQRSSQGFTFRLGSGSVSWRSTRSSSILSSSCEADIYAWAMAA